MAISAERKNAPANTLGIRRIMVAVEGIEDVLACPRVHRAELVGELVQYDLAKRAALSQNRYRILKDR